jgi:hypothetical protein
MGRVFSEPTEGISRMADWSPAEEPKLRKKTTKQITVKIPEKRIIYL